MANDIDYDSIQTYLAFAPIGGGSSWGTAATAFEAIDTCRKLLKSDWNASGKGYINVYDITPVKRWWKTIGQEMRGESEKDGSTIEVPYLYSVSVDFGNHPPKRKGKGAK